MSRKTDRKQKKCQHIVEKETNIKCTSKPTKYIAICNAGLVNGLSEEIVYEEFRKYGAIETIAMLPGKSCCFVSFSGVDAAIQAFNGTNGILNIGQNNKPIYLSFMENILSVPRQYANPPNGLIVLENYITEDEEKLLLALCNFKNSESSPLKLRQVKHYGFEFQYDINNVDKEHPLKERIPTECDFLWSKLKLSGVPFNDFEPDQLTVNCYNSGQGIPPHVDTHSAFEDPIIILSLGTSVIMNFKNGNDCYPQFLSQRSLAILSGECRYNWTHGITPRKLDIISMDKGLTAVKRETRVSYTFRKIRKGECNCEYVDKCDSYSRCQKTIINNDLAVELEKKHVHDVYENIAAHFSDTRCKPWPNILTFLESMEIGSVLIDIGCGNGKYLGCRNDIFSIGCDSSFGLVNVCKQRGFEVFTCTCLKLPLKNCIADGIISIAVIHHLANDERRLQAIKEMVRVLRVNGKALIYVWAKDQNKNEEKTSYLKQDRKNRKGDCHLMTNHITEHVAVGSDVCLPVHINRKQFQHQDMLVPWKLKSDDASIDNSFLRFYHVFEENELEKLCSLLDNIKIIKSYYDEGNWCCIFKKIQ